MIDYTVISLILVFLAGYIFITLEHFTKINKSTVALIMAAVLWLILYEGGGSPLDITHALKDHAGEISQIVFFLLGALAIVETINVHQGFNIISNAIEVTSKRKLLWVSGFIAFFLSAVLDNLTTTIVMVSLLAKLIEKGEDRLIIGGGIVIAANAGGAWTPIGDVTTTMLWIGGQISTLTIMRDLFLPSIGCMLVSLYALQFSLNKMPLKPKHAFHKNAIEPDGTLVFYLGVGTLISVPLLKILTGLPPFMGMLFGLGIMWLITDLLHAQKEERGHLRVPSVLTKIDFAGVLFFLGILLAVEALDTAGLLKQLAVFLDQMIGQPDMIAVFIGIASAVVDNVPLVAATMSMYNLSQFPVDHSFWQLVAFCAGTGGSILIIGSAAGVVFMGLEKVDFLWYVRRISLAALLGYFAGIGIYQVVAWIH